MLRIGSVLGRFTRLSLTAVPVPETLMQKRTKANIFVRVSAEDLWRSVTSVSNAGRKRGRASKNSRKTSTNLNMGQIFGKGKINMVWPGLNASVVRGREVVTQQRLPEDKEMQEKILELRNKKQSRRTMKLHPLERGWSGTKPGGRFFGPPDPVGGNNFEGFESIVVSSKMAIPMRTQGRYRIHRVVVVVGNFNGLVGFAAAASPDPRAAIRKAKNKAGQRLAYYELCDNHTVFHNFYTEFSDAKLFVRKKQHGYGLNCHRVIAAICKLVGIKNMHAKLDKRKAGANNLCKAFLIGLRNQVTFQELAEKKRLHVVECRQENGYFPKVVASPKEAPVRTEDEIDVSEILDFDVVLNDGQVREVPPKKVAFYKKLPGWQTYLKKTDILKNDKRLRVEMWRKYGRTESYLTYRIKMKERERLRKLKEEQERYVESQQ